MIQLKFFVSCILLSVITEISSQNQLKGYDLTRPDAKFILPDILHEISGLTELDTTSFACIQDENGILFIYDLMKNEIKKEIPFGFDGDYEGIARVGKTVYVLRSDGSIFEIPDYTTDKYSTRYHITNIPATNNEGLCYDRSRNRLLIGCKGKVSDLKEEKDRRLIYAFDLKTKKLSAEPVFEFDAGEITRFAVEKKVIDETRENKKGKTVLNHVKVSTSEIAIHPVTDDLYLLSASDRMLFTFGTDGKIKGVFALDPLYFNKPEGITFFANGDMLITNEGQGMVPTLLRFNYRS